MSDIPHPHLTEFLLSFPHDPERIPVLYLRYGAWGVQFFETALAESEPTRIKSWSAGLTKFSPHFSRGENNLMDAMLACVRGPGAT